MIFNYLKKSNSTKLVFGSLILGSVQTSVQLYSTNVQAQSIQNSLKFAVKVIPHPEKAHKGGEDAYYAGSNILAVADGVGGWADHGVDPALYSKELCQNIKEFWNNNISKYIQSPKNLIIDAKYKTKAVGSSTCCIVTLDQIKPILYSSYIGDSGYLIIRKEQEEMKLVYVSPEHTRDFNFPYQIGSQGDDPKISLINQHKIMDKDLVITYTDGVCDNLSEQQILDVVKQFKNDDYDVNKIVNSIADLAYSYSLKQNYMSPFAKRAIQYGYRYIGGKSDDITILVAQIQLAQQPKL